MVQVGYLGAKVIGIRRDYLDRKKLKFVRIKLVKKESCWGLRRDN